MSNENRYNGWSNYETWIVKLWMDNDEGSYHYWQNMTEGAIERCQDKNAAINELAESLKDEHMESLPELQGFAADLMNAAMSEVDWYEIAEALVNDALEGNPELLEEKDEEAS